MRELSAMEFMNSDNYILSVLTKEHLLKMKDYCFINENEYELMLKELPIHFKGKTREWGKMNKLSIKLNKEIKFINISQVERPFLLNKFQFEFLKQLFKADVHFISLLTEEEREEEKNRGWKYLFDLFMMNDRNNFRPYTSYTVKKVLNNCLVFPDEDEGQESWRVDYSKGDKCHD